MLKRIIAALLALSLMPAAFCEENPAPDYSDKQNWVYFETYEDRDVDVFFLYSTLHTGGEGAYNATIEESIANHRYRYQTKRHKYIYDYKSRFFAPYYRQLSFDAYLLGDEGRREYTDIAVSDALNAFRYYLENVNGGRPFILAGYSQGAEMCLEIMKEFGSRDDFNENMIAAYMIGWRLTEADTTAYPFLKPAAREDDTGVIVCMECEAPFVEDSISVPEGARTYSINPLNWLTDSTPADRSLNKGACFFGYTGNVKTTKYRFCGAYIDPERGTIIVSDVSPDEYGPGSSVLPYGSYHVYSYQFFCMNLKNNVQTRMEAFKAEREKNVSAAE